MPSCKRICLWSGPRNISTTLMYSFAQRKDTLVVDEPLYAFYLAKTGAASFHPGAANILKEQEVDGEKVIQEILHNTKKPVQFYKQMTHHLQDLDRNFLKDVTNIILTRDPKEMLPSYDAVIPNPTMEDVGYQLHHELISYFKANNIPYIVLDAKEVLLNPEGKLKKLCEKLKIPFDRKMLTWPKGTRPEDGSWSKYWYKNIHNSTGFMTYKPKVATFPPHLKPLLKECLPYYNKLRKLAL